MPVGTMIDQSEYHDTQLKTALPLTRLFEIIHMLLSRDMN